MTLVKPGKIKELSDIDKHKVLENHFKPSEKFSLPKTYLQGCNRFCKTSYLTTGFMYSKLEVAVYCIYCILFARDCHEKSLNSFVNRVFSNWHQITHTKSRHEGNHDHNTLERLLKESLACSKSQVPQFPMPH